MSRYTLYSSPDAAHQAWDEHGLVFTAIQTGDSEGALQAMRAHLKNGLHGVRELVN